MDYDVKKIAILQSNYVPWKGYFDLIAAVDEFILYDDMQFTKNDWRNRNQIKTPQGVQWLTVPVGKDIHRRIRDVQLVDGWQTKHWKTLESNYRRAAHFDAIASWLRPLYLDASYSHLTQLNKNLIKAICDYLGIHTRISCSWDYELGEGKTERLVDLCLQAGATAYISGPSAKDYLQPELLQAQGIDLHWFDYSDYREYPQLWGSFVHGVSILDLLFNCGPKSQLYMKFAIL